jgi:hypothetical protein
MAATLEWVLSQHSDLATWSDPGPPKQKKGIAAAI